jgi:hypothetical protein
MLHYLNDGRRIAVNILEVQTNSLALSELAVGKGNGIMK